MESDQVYDAEEKTFEEVLIDLRPKLLRNKMFEWSQKGDIYHLSKYLRDKQFEVLGEDEQKWTCLQWAIVCNQVEAVKVILIRVEEVRKVSIDNVEEKELEQNDKNIIIEVEKKFRKIIANSEEKNYNPLHWSAYKGNNLISSLLIRAKYDPMEIDMYGNNALHQAAASNKLESIKFFMGLGMDLDTKNARSHTPADLTSNEEILKLLKIALDKLQCDLCKCYFSFEIKKYQCYIENTIVCKNCCILDYYYDNAKSESKEILQCLSKTCFEKIDNNEKSLRDALSENDLSKIVSINNNIKLQNIRINPKLVVETELNIDRLKREEKIMKQIGSLENVTDHKTIEKSVFMLLKEVEDAREIGFELTSNVVGPFQLHLK